MNSKRLPALLLATMLALSPAPGRAQVTNALFTLLEGSAFSDDCLICARPTLIYPLRGTFEVLLEDSNPLFSTYRLTNISFYAGTGAGTNALHRITGTGSYRIGGEVALVQEMTLDVQVNEAPLVFTNGPGGTEKLFPLIEVGLAQTQMNLVQFFSMNLVAAPAREIWFSTASSFTSGNKPLHGSGGDLLSADGRIVKSISNLVAALDLSSGASMPGIDALDIGPGGEVFFSFNENQSSPTLGNIQHGDLVSNRGRIVARNQALTEAFGLMPAVPDLGLDAVMVKSDGEILFSIQTDAFSEKLGVTLHHGDLLSDTGQVVASNPQLLSRFHPTAAKDHGLDALYVWPSGEIWFSTEEGFQDEQLGPVLAGDLLSNQGLIVFRNLELTSAFAPIEDLADFGLDGLFIITDLTAREMPPRFVGISKPSASKLSLFWEGQGRAFQVERALDVSGPYLPASPLLPDLLFDDTDATNSAGFYRLRQW